MTDQMIRVVPAAVLVREAKQKGWGLRVIQGRFEFRSSRRAIDAANKRTAAGTNNELVVSEDRSGTFTVLEIWETNI